MKALDLTGQRFGRLTVERRDGSQGGKTVWLAKCDCGGAARVTASNLRRGNTQSCGCLHVARAAGLNRRHGASSGRTATPTYRSWKNMKMRCLSPACPAFPRYGGRGIKVCERWLLFENFLADMGERPSLDHSIDRVDNDGNYEPGNCRWATRVEQSTNRSGRRLLTHAGITKTQAEWERAQGLRRGTISDRRNRCSWQDGDAIVVPALNPKEARRYRERRFVE